MAAARLKAFDNREEELVHKHSLRCLDEIGVMIKSESVRADLERAGAKVDHKTGVTRIPGSMVKEALGNAPKSFILCAREPKHDKPVPVKSHPWMATTGLAVYTLDLETGARRSTTSKDLANFSRMADAMNGVDICWTTVTAHDVVQKALAPHSLWTALQNNTKHIQVVPPTNGAEDARKQVELASLVAGGKEQLKKRPLFSVIMCPVAPLSFEKHSVEAQAEFARAGIPIVCMSMSLSGGSAPVTVAGTIVNINSENLASLVISQVSSKGAPFIYSSESAPIDMTTGVMDYIGYEIPLINAGASQMAHRYGLPCMVSSWGTETKEPGIQCSFSELSVTLVGNMVGSDLCSGAGSIDSAKGASLEQVVIDSYLWENCIPMMRGFEVSEDSIALDVTKAVGHGNTYLKHVHTARNFRKHIAFRDQTKKLWEATLSTKMAPEAREVARKVLKEHKVPPLAPDVLMEGDKLLEEYDKRLSG
ncbi:MAG TPA: trimethylamine methyltransferase family protein [Thermoplasmata archaeon]